MPTAANVALHNHMCYVKMSVMIQIFDIHLAHGDLDNVYVSAGTSDSRSNVRVNGKNLCLNKIELLIALFVWVRFVSIDSQH